MTAQGGSGSEPRQAMRPPSLPSWNWKGQSTVVTTQVIADLGILLVDPSLPNLTRAAAKVSGTLVSLQHRRQCHSWGGGSDVWRSHRSERTAGADALRCDCCSGSEHRRACARGECGGAGGGQTGFPLCPDARGWLRGVHAFYPRRHVGLRRP